jgi:2'-5' RNA ligase
VPARHPRLFAVDLEDEDGRAAAVAEAVDEALAEAGLFPRERRAFWAHVTVARVRRGARATAVGEDPPAGPAFRAAGLTLYRSRVGPSGSRYEALRRTDLG